MIAKLVRAAASRPRRTATIFLLALMVLVYFRWLNFDIFTYGDWNFKFTQTLRESTWPYAWVGNIGFGSFNEFIWRMPLDVMFGLFAWLGLGINVSDKFLIFWPLVLTSVVAPYVFVREVTRRRLAAMAATLFYATNTYFLAINSQGHQLLPLAFNVLTIALAVLVRALRSGKTLHFVVAALGLFIAGCIDFRVFYIGFFLLSVYMLFFWPRSREKNFRRALFKKTILFYSITIGLQIYWLMAFAANYEAQSSEVLARSLFGNSYWDLSSVMTLHHPFWDGVSTTWFVSNRVPFYFWATPILAFIPLLFKPRPKYLTFFAVTALVGILLGKQVSEPLREIYTFLFEHFPGFSAFREATKFYYLTLLGYSVMLGYLITYLFDMRPRQLSKKLLRNVVAGVFVVLCLLNAWPYISGSMQRLLSPRALPNDYALLEKQLDNKEKDSYSRTLWVPASSRWSYYSQQHPRLNATTLLTTKLDNPGDKRDVPTQKDLLGLLNSETFGYYLSVSSVKYVIVPLRDIDNQNDFFGFYGDSRQPYIDALDRLPFLKRVNGVYKEVAVYENTSYQPYAAVSTKLYSLPAKASFMDAYPFLLGALKDSTYSFATNKSLPKSNLNDVFAGLSTEDFARPAVPVLADNKSKQFFLDTNRQYYSYKIKHGTISLYKAKGTISAVSSGNLTIGQSVPVLANRVRIEPGKTYYLMHQGGVTPIDLKLPERNFGSLAGAVSLYASQNVNLLPNGSFEQGTWEKSVRDCDPYDPDPRIGMNENYQDKTSGQKALTLWALRHTACVRSAPMNVTPGTYLLNFRYIAMYSDQISFRVIMDGKDSPAAMRSATNTNGGWATHIEKITIPAGVTKVQIELRGLPPGSFSAQARFTTFDDVQFSPLQETVVTDIESGKPMFQAVHQAAQHSTTGISISGAVAGQNLIPNPSLEDGLWQKTVGDCNNYDEQPQISMRQTNVASEGKRAIELRARRHIACSGPVAISVKEGSAYLLRFEYQSPNSKTASLGVTFDDFGKTSRSKTLKSTDNWQTYQEVIKVPLGATHLSMRVSAVSDETGDKETINRYDNFSLIEVPDVQGMLFSLENSMPVNAPKSIVSKHISSTKKQFIVRGTKDPFYLTMGEAYHPGWRLAGVADADHFEAVGFLNGWYIDAARFCNKNTASCTKNSDGTHDLHLTANFTPQNKVALGAFISAIVLLITAVIFGRELNKIGFDDQPRRSRPALQTEGAKQRAVSKR